MNHYAAHFMKFMDENGIKYADLGDDSIKVTYTGSNLATIPVYIFFDSDDQPMAALKCWDIAIFPEDKRLSGILTCNELNVHYRWATFAINQKNEVEVSIDTYVDDVTCGAECSVLVRRLVNIVDEAYPTIMKSIWA